jgi:hypothetical protein
MNEKIDASTIATTYAEMSEAELLHLAETREQLTALGRMALDTEMARRGLTEKDITMFVAGVEQAEAQRAVDNMGVSHFGAGKRLIGRANCTRDALTGIEEYDTTLWALLFWFPIFPIRSLRIRKDKASDDELQVLECRPRDWGQIFRTWLLAIFFVIVICVGLPVLMNLFR